jgi:hypothetical protein
MIRQSDYCTAFPNYVRGTLGQIPDRNGYECSRITTLRAAHIEGGNATYLMGVGEG